MFTVRSHSKIIFNSALAGLLCCSLGCSLPIIPADDVYEVLGGIVQREHPSLGRANSAFDLSKSELSAEAESAQAAPVVPSIFRDPQPLERLNHSPIIP